MVQMAKSWAERWGLNIGTALALVLLAAALISQWGGFQRDSERQRELVAAVSALEAALAAEMEARKLLGLTLQNLESRGAERTARRDADIAALNGRLATLENKYAVRDTETARILGELQADVRTIKERLSGRAAMTVPDRAG